MGAVQLPDELQRVIERQVAEGRASSPAAFLEEAVMRLVDDARSEQNDILAVVEAGTADIAAGHYTAVASAGDAERLHERIMERLRARLASGE